jgi:hypothetical protein
VNVTVRFLRFFAERLEEVDVASFRNRTDSQLHKYDNGAKTFRRVAEKSLTVLVRHFHHAQKVTFRCRIGVYFNICSANFIFSLIASIEPVVKVKR